MNYTDRLKEEQERTLNKEMRDILLRQNMGNQTMSIARLQQNNPSTPSSSSQTGTLSSVNIEEAGIDSQLEQARQQQETRRQQTGNEHRSRLRQGVGSLAARMFNLTPFGTGGESEPELMTEAEMQTAREQPSETDMTILNSLKFRNPNASETQLTRATNVLSKFKNLQPEQLLCYINR